MITQVLHRVIGASCIARSRSPYPDSATTRATNPIQNKQTQTITRSKSCKYRTRDHTGSPCPQPTPSKSRTEEAVSWWLRVPSSPENRTTSATHASPTTSPPSKSQVPKPTGKRARPERASCSLRQLRYLQWAPKVEPKVLRSPWRPSRPKNQGLSQLRRMNRSKCNQATHRRLTCSTKLTKRRNETEIFGWTIYYKNDNKQNRWKSPKDLEKYTGRTISSMNN